MATPPPPTACQSTSFSNQHNFKQGLSRFSFQQGSAFQLLLVQGVWPWGFVSGFYKGTVHNRNSNAELGLSYEFSMFNLWVFGLGLSVLSRRFGDAVSPGSPVHLHDLHSLLLPPGFVYDQRLFLDTDDVLCPFLDTQQSLRPKKQEADNRCLILFP